MNFQTILYLLEAVVVLVLIITGWHFLCKLTKIKDFGIISIFVFLFLGKVFSWLSAAVLNKYPNQSPVFNFVGEAITLLIIVSFVSFIISFSSLSNGNFKTTKNED